MTATTRVERTTASSPQVHHLAPLMGAFVVPQGCAAFLEEQAAPGRSTGAASKRPLIDRWWRWLAGSAVIYPGGATAQFLLASDED